MVADLAGRLDALLAEMLANAFREHVDDADLDAAVDAFRSTVEGVYAREPDAARRRRVLRFTASRFLH